MSKMECLHPEKKVKRIIWKRSKEKEEDTAENGTSMMKMEGNVEKRPRSDSMTSDLDGPCMMALLPLPNLEESTSGAPVVLTGTACKGATGPPVGVVDIGVSSSAYYFRIALPGVKKDPAKWQERCVFYSMWQFKVEHLLFHAFTSCYKSKGTLTMTLFYG
ncbi:increased DNA methylation 3-like isoform X2 [Lycium ferocissimum]|uniref:increased DNA methylation 3-like isoform X2 n=1 Tax=Lycium ferocissimum TaxID=112874 RepID=UPI002815B7F2|nr:increased DNA methylation 3-like isoform X2 [Lycium ferocissimum]